MDPVPGQTGTRLDRLLHLLGQVGRECADLDLGVGFHAVRLARSTARGAGVERTPPRSTTRGFDRSGVPTRRRGDQ